MFGKQREMFHSAEILNTPKKTFIAVFHHQQQLIKGIVAVEQFVGRVYVGCWSQLRNTQEILKWNKLSVKIFYLKFLESQRKKKNKTFAWFNWQMITFQSYDFCSKCTNMFASFWSFSPFFHFAFRNWFKEPTQDPRHKKKREREKALNHFSREFQRATKKKSI